MKGNHNKVEDHNYKEIEKAKRLFYKNVSEMRDLDKLAVAVNDWEYKYGINVISLPAICEIEQRQRACLINAMYYNVTAKVKDAEIDSYLKWKVTVLTL